MVFTDEAGPIKSLDACCFFHRYVRDKASYQLMQLKDQGKIVRSLNNDSTANGSKWHFTGLNTRFKD